MIDVKGSFNSARVFTDNVEEEAIHQIRELCNQEFVKESKIRIMPDTHAGAGCTIGTTMTIKDRVVPNLVGVDIGCGMETVKLKEKHIEVEQLDKVIHSLIPAGAEIRKEPHKFAEEINLEELKCKKQVNLKRAMLSIGSLGGGNHFIEAGKDESGSFYLVVHSGSRNIGKQCAEYYQERAFKEMSAKYSEQKITKALAYLEGTGYEEYIHDMKIIQRYADLNRKAIIDEIVRKMKFHIIEQFTTIHNYIDMDNMILRKGAVSAKTGEKILIPINMRDGSLICIGKGNPDWNFSAPHGAGRLMSRRKAKDSVSMVEFKESMKGIYSSTISKDTIDEAPMVYKPIEEIVENIKDSCEIVGRIKPVYNFKAGE